MTVLEDDNPLVLTLKRQLPSAVVVAVSFADELPHPARVRAQDRSTLLRATQARATEFCLQTLARLAGHQSSTGIAKLPTGDRNWPTGFVGSVSHKGTVVIAALAPKTTVPVLGIDLERIDGSSFGGGKEVVAPEGLPSFPNAALAVLVAFSAKEATFKAQFRLTGVRTKFDQVKLEWLSVNHDEAVARASCALAFTLAVRCTIHDKWVLCVATAETG